MSDRKQNAGYRPRRVEEAAAQWVARRDAGLAPAEEGEFQVWLAADGQHRMAWRRFEVAWSTLGRAAKPRFVESILEDLALLDRRRRRRRLAAAAFVGIALFGVASFWRSSLQTRELPPVAAASSDAVVLLPETRTLADNSVVELRDGAAISPHFTPTLRTLTLRSGEAHFQIAKDYHRPFVVEAAGVEVRAVGTAFSVHLDGRSVEIIVTEGTVAVRKPGDPPLNLPSSASAAAGPLAALGSSSNLVAAGHSVVVQRPADGDATLQVAPVSRSEIERRLAWRSARIDFTSAPLSEAVALLNKYAEPVHGVHFIIADPGIEKTLISGLFRADDADAFVGILAGGFGITAERQGEHEILLRKAP